MRGVLDPPVGEMMLGLPLDTTDEGWQAVIVPDPGGKRAVRLGCGSRPDTARHGYRGAYGLAWT